MYFNVSKDIHRFSIKCMVNEWMNKWVSEWVDIKYILKWIVCILRWWWGLETRLHSTPVTELIPRRVMPWVLKLWYLPRGSVTPQVSGVQHLIQKVIFQFPFVLYFNYLPTSLFYACLVYWLIFSLCPGWSSLWTLLSVTFSLPPMLQEWGRGNATSVLPIPPSPNTPASNTHPLGSNLGKGFQIWIGVHSTDAVVSCYDKRLDSR